MSCIHPRAADPEHFDPNPFLKGASEVGSNFGSRDTSLKGSGTGIGIRKFDLYSGQQFLERKKKKVTFTILFV